VAANVAAVIFGLVLIPNSDEEAAGEAAAA
jgi:hypothetical protein